MADVADLFKPAPVGGAAPVHRRQGTVVTFDQATLENTVDVGGTVFTDLPLLGVAEAATLATGSVVCVDWTGTEYVIIGRIVRPNTADATDAINRLSNNILSESVATGEDGTSTTYADLATIGPVVTPTVGSSGRLLVFVSANIRVIDDVTGVRAGYMSVEVRDSTNAVIYLPVNLPEVSFEYTDDAAHLIGDKVASGRAFLLEDLTPGEYRLTAKYQVGASGNTATFAFRNVTTFAL